MARSRLHVRGESQTKVPGAPRGASNGPMATGKTQTQSGQGKNGNPKRASSVTSRAATR
jgi:hypothetical protein